MELIPLFLEELDREAETTRKMLSKVSADKFGWQPHPKSMTVKTLATHIAEIPTWIKMVFETDEIDFSTSPYNPVELNNEADLLAYFEKVLAEGREALQNANEAQLEEKWSIRDGAQVFFTDPKRDVIRMCYCQIVHHRAQLGVFLRLLDIPIPGSYGPSADELEQMQSASN